MTFIEDSYILHKIVCSTWHWLYLTAAANILVLNKSNLIIIVHCAMGYNESPILSSIINPIPSQGWLTFKCSSMQWYEWFYMIMFVMNFYSLRWLVILVSFVKNVLVKTSNKIGIIVELYCCLSLHFTKFRKALNQIYLKQFSSHIRALCSYIVGRMTYFALVQV